jgi:hypothetical protein
MTFLDWGSERIFVQRSTEILNSSQLAIRGHSIFFGILVQTDGTNDVTVSLYDNVKGEGKQIIPAQTVLAASSRNVSISMDPPLECTRGIYLVISGTNAKAQIFYSSKEA